MQSPLRAISFFYVVSTTCHSIHCHAAISPHDRSNRCNTLWCHHSVCLTGPVQSVTELMPFMNCPVHRYTCCSDRHASPYWTVIRRWTSMGFTPSLLKKLITERCSSLVQVASGAAIFKLPLRSRVAFLHRTATCRPLFKPFVSMLSSYKKIERCSEIYRIF